MNFHLQTHKVNRPPLQIRDNPHAPLIFNPAPPPSLILRLHHLDRLSATVRARAATIQADLTTTKLVETYLSQKAEPPQTTAATTESPEPDPDWVADLFETWKRHQLRNPFLAPQVYTSAHRHLLLTMNN